MLRRYFEALAGFRRRAAWCAALSVASGLFEAVGIAAVLPLLSGALADRSDLGREFFGLRGDDLATAAVIALVVFGVLAAVLRYFADVAVIRLRGDVEESLRARMTAALLRMGWPSFLHLSLGETGKSVLIEASEVGIGSFYFVSGVGYSIVAMVFVTMALVISPAMTGATLAFGAVMAIVYRLVGRRAEESSRNLSVEAAELTETTTDILGNAKFYRLSGLRGAATARAHATYSAWKRLFVRVQRWQPLTRLVFDSASLLFIGAVLAVALVVRGDSPLEPLVFLALFYRLTPKLQQAQQGLLGARTQTSWWSTWNERYTGAVAEAEVASGSIVPTSAPNIAFEHVSYAFPGQDDGVLDDVSWVLEPGGCLAIVGESGGGKTTILDIVSGLLRPTSGRVLLGDLDLTDVDLEAWRARIGFVMQDAPMFFGTVVENIAWGTDEADRDRASRAASVAHLDDVIRNLPAGLDTRVGQRGARLSGGQRQRVALARALYRSPWLLVLDEATSALDSESEREIQSALSALKGAMSMLVVAHRLRTVEIADWILVLAGGRVVEQGTWTDLYQSKGVFWRMATSQDVDETVGVQVDP